LKGMLNEELIVMKMLGLLTKREGSSNPLKLYGNIVINHHEAIC